jgi:hypothetical protein
MANYSEAYLKITESEFSNNPEKFLHQNPNEDGLTIGGIYQKSNPDTFDWGFIQDVLEICHFDFERASRMLYADEATKQAVFKHFKTWYWNKCLLDEIQSQVIAENIFLAAVHIGVKNAVKLAQKVVQTQQDGIMGAFTIKALTNFDDNYFKARFDKLEIENYNNLIARNPHLAWARNGFIKRAYYV